MCARIAGRCGRAILIDERTGFSSRLKQIALCGSAARIFFVEESRTTAAVQDYLNELAKASSGAAPADSVVRALLGRAVARLEMLCSVMLKRKYSRLTQPPLNLEVEDLLGAVVERLLKGMRNFKPETTRHFFAMANQHIRWELNDLARRIDSQTPAVELRE